jgi:hypothetical protein
MNKLSVILRTHSRSSVHFQERLIPVSKTELIILCLKSLIISLSRVKNWEINLTIVDDHSDASCIEQINKTIIHSPFSTELTTLPGSGNNDSMRYCYTLARNSSNDLIYLVEDDYLHKIECLPEMLETYLYLKNKFEKYRGGGEVSLMPVDNHFHYNDNTMFSSPLVLGPRQHWRVNYYSNWTMLLEKQSLIRNWNNFMQFSNYQLKDPSTHEDATLVPIFKEGGVNLFTPVPSLAIHVASPVYVPPFTDWNKTWKEIENEWNLHWLHV